jgi:hypothetical protein
MSCYAMRVFRIGLDRDIEKSHGLDIRIGSVNLNVQWRSWQCDEDGYDPWMLSFRVFVWGWKWPLNYTLIAPVNR